MTSLSWSEMVRTTTRVSGASVEICRVASTPVMPGMFRSITTTSGADSLTSWTACAPPEASPITWTPCSSSNVRRPARKRSWSSTMRTRTVSSAAGCWAFTIAGRREVYSALVQADGDGSAAPGAGVGVAREPEVDRRPGDPRADVGRDALAVAGNRHARAERDHAWVDGDDAPADGEAGCGRPVQRVAGRNHGHGVRAYNGRRGGRARRRCHERDALRLCGL